MSDPNNIFELGTLPRVCPSSMVGKNEHHIILYDDNAVACMLCDEKHTIPEPFSRSSGFVEVVYTLFLFGKVTNESCSNEMEQDDTSINPTNPYSSRNNLRIPTENVYWSDNKTTGGSYDNTYSSSSWSVKRDLDKEDIKQLRENVVEPES